MTVLVTYMSQTGNTRKVAEAIYEAIVGEKEIKPMDQVQGLDGYELTFVGFPIHQFGIAKPAKEFLESKARGKKVALFYTHASWSDPSLPPQVMELIKKFRQSVTDAAAGSTVLGTFDCRGELGEAVAQGCLKSRHCWLLNISFKSSKEKAFLSSKGLWDSRTFCNTFGRFRPCK